jgi:hypothetical protein
MLKGTGWTFRFLVLVFLIVQAISSDVYGERVQGDFDGNGVVDFKDFLVFAGNFGKTGDVFDPDTIAQATVYDTVKVFVQELITPQEGDGIFPDLTSVVVAFPSKANWDADAENDGLQYEIWFKNSNDGAVDMSGARTSIPVTIEVSLAVGGEVVYKEVMQGPAGLFYDGSFSGPKQRINRERIEPFDRVFTISIKLITPKQGIFESPTRSAYKEVIGDR